MTRLTSLLQPNIEGLIKNIGNELVTACDKLEPIAKGGVQGLPWSEGKPTDIGIVDWSSTTLLQAARAEIVKARGDMQEARVTQIVYVLLFVYDCCFRYGVAVELLTLHDMIVGHRLVKCRCGYGFVDIGWRNVAVTLVLWTSARETMLWL